MLPKAENSWTWEEAAHLLNRAGFGGNPEEISQLHAIGRFKAVERLLQPTEAMEATSLPEWATAEKIAESARERFEAIRENRRNSEGLSAEQVERMRREALNKLQQEERRHGTEAQGWWLDRMFTTLAPLREKMTLFFHDHFATSMQKVKQPALLVLQNQLFRQHDF